ncbi:hypothetical protein EDC01DRAFT_765456 [Geopyxis carbonaria]|nr:hypothetical protein EDC01DRAFT_765456 [Geopyxis carbonaria]
MHLLRLSHRTLLSQCRLSCVASRRFPLIPAVRTASFSTNPAAAAAAPAWTELDADGRPLPKRWTPPPTCPGCGAASQQTHAELPGFYPLKPKKPAELEWAGLPATGHGPRKTRLDRRTETADVVWKAAMERLAGDAAVLQELGVDSADSPEPRPVKNVGPKAPPVCHRCHYIKFSHSAPPLPAPPTLDTLSELILASPHKTHHVYHLVDAVDLPLSLLRKLRGHFHSTLPNRITRNLTVSYVITRCDVLTPKRAQISSLMTFLKQTVKARLPKDEKVEGPAGSETKIWAVSSRKGWDIGGLKDEIKHRAGGVWFVGGVNVGKTSLLRDAWPQNGKQFTMEGIEVGARPKVTEPEETELVGEGEEDTGKQLEGLLSQVQQSHRPREPPTISDVPGTTAAPIRVAYNPLGGRSKLWGELVDLPGLERFGSGDLLKYARADKRKDFRVRGRVYAEEYTVQPGQSILVGGLFMITPKTDVTVMVNPFTTLPIHIAATAKCCSFLTHPSPQDSSLCDTLLQDPAAVGAASPKPTIINDEPHHLPSNIASAGVFTIADDVTEKRNPMLMSAHPAAIRALPYKVLATDLLLDSLGWIELTAQVRNRQDTGFQKVDVEVHAPEGRGVGQRHTMGAYMMLDKSAMLGGLKKKTARPKMSKKGSKKGEKLRRRAQNS